MPRRWKLVAVRNRLDEVEEIVSNRRMSSKICIDDKFLLRFWQRERPSEVRFPLAPGLDPSGVTYLFVV